MWNKNSRPEVYTEVHFWTGYFQKANGKYIFNNLLILRSIFTRLMRLPFRKPFEKNEVDTRR